MKLDNRNTTMSKKIDYDVISASCDVIVIFLFMPNLEVIYAQSGSWIPEASSVILTFSLTVIFYPTKTENRTKKFLTKLSYY